MPRGRPRKFNPAIPAHIDQARIPRGIYWDGSGAGRWYVVERGPAGGKPATHTIAGPRAQLSDLHALAEERTGAARGTVAAVIDAYHASLKFKAIGRRTQRDYNYYAAAIKAYKTKLGCPFGDLVVDRLSQPVIRRFIDVIAAPTPSKANHWLRYLRRVFNWGIEFGECKTNPARGVECVTERRAHRMPEATVFRAVQAFARARGALQPRARGAVAPYLWAAMEIAYQARLRGIEVTTLTDAYDFGDALQTNRRKGSRDNIVRTGAHLREAIDALLAYRARIWEKKHTPVPLRADQRPLFVNESGSALSKSGFDTTFQRMMRLAVKEGVITAAQRFGLHGLKHRGVTDTKGNRADKKTASGHVTDTMTNLYDHELPRVEPADDA